MLRQRVELDDEQLEEKIRSALEEGKQVIVQDNTGSSGTILWLRAKIKNGAVMVKQRRGVYRKVDLTDLVSEIRSAQSKGKTRTGRWRWHVLLEGKLLIQQD